MLITNLTCKRGLFRKNKSKNSYKNAASHISLISLETTRRPLRPLVKIIEEIEGGMLIYRLGLSLEVMGPDICKWFELITSYIT